MVIESAASADHVPPQQIFAKRIRRDHNLDRLVRSPTHGICNGSFGKDEEYFAWSLVPLAGGTYAADALIGENGDKVRAGDRQGLAKQVMSEFECRPGGLFLPDGKVIKRANSSRISRVQWKIIRGLYHLETGCVLPETTDFLVEIREPEGTGGTEMDDFWEAVKATPSKGQYQAVFAYKYRRMEATRGSETAVVHTWGTLFWDRLMIFLAHLDPDPKFGPPDQGSEPGAT